MISLKTGDTKPLDVVLKRGVQPIDLTDATVSFVMAPQNGGSSGISGECSVLEAEAGQVRYAWAAGETDDEGLYYAEWHVTRSGSVETFPAHEYETISISHRLP